MNNVLKTIGLFILILISCSAVGAQDSTSTVKHVVLVWLKEPGNEQHRQQLIETSNSFREIPGVQAVSAGEPLQNDRPVVDDTFDVAVVITFDSALALQRYEAHPVHLRAVEEVLRPMTERMVVYDFVER